MTSNVPRNMLISNDSRLIVVLKAYLGSSQKAHHVCPNGNRELERIKDVKKFRRGRETLGQLIMMIVQIRQK